MPIPPPLQIQGLMNVTAPTAAGPTGRAGKAGPPIFLSYPHYCGADPRLAAGVEGLGCRPRRHNLFVDVGESPAAARGGQAGRLAQPSGTASVWGAGGGAEEEGVGGRLGALGERWCFSRGAPEEEGEAGCLAHSVSPVPRHSKLAGCLAR